jgi:hypothetical protein
MKTRKGEVVMKTRKGEVVMKTRHKSIMCIAIAGCLSLALTGQAGIIWQENFESIATNATGSATTANSTIVGSGASFRQIIADTTFGSTRALRAAPTGGDSFITTTMTGPDIAAASSAVRLQFDMHATSITDNGYFIIQLRNSTSNVLSDIRVDLRSTTVKFDKTAFSYGTIQAIDIWFNNTSSAINYVDPYSAQTIILDSGKANIYMNGAMTSTNYTRSGSAALDTDITQMQFRGGTTISTIVNVADLRFDNFVMSDAIPEPTTISMLCIGSLTLFMARLHLRK